MTRTQAATPLRQRMLDDMRLRNMADGTRRSYVRSVADFSAFRCAAEPSSMVVRAHMVQKSIIFRIYGGAIGVRATACPATMTGRESPYARLRFEHRTPDRARRLLSPDRPSVPLGQGRR